MKEKMLGFTMEVEEEIVAQAVMIAAMAADAAAGGE